MKHVILEITEYDLDIFKALVHSNNQDESLDWVMPLEGEAGNIKIHFRREQDKEDEDEQ